MLEQARDVVIIIAGVAVAAGALIFAILMLVIFRKVSPMIDTARELVADLRNVSSLVRGRTFKPVSKGAVFAAGVRGALTALSRGASGKEKGNGKRK